MIVKCVSMTLAVELQDFPPIVPLQHVDPYDSRKSKAHLKEIVGAAMEETRAWTEADQFLTAATHHRVRERL